MKISLNLDSAEDYEVISNATSHYHKNVNTLIEFQGRAQHFMHRSILVQFRYDLMKRMMSQSPAKKPKLKMDLHTALVVLDALRNYSGVCHENPESAKLQRLIMDIGPLLPKIQDQDNLSLLSEF